MTPTSETLPQVRIVLRPYASALPLGTFSFAIGNILFSAFLLHWIPVHETKLLAVMLLAFVAPLELIACGMAFLSRDTGAATVMGIFSVSWVVQGLQLILFGQGSASPATGILLLLLSVCLTLLAAVTFRGKPLVGILLSLAVIRSVGAATVEFGAGPTSEIFTACAGLALGLSAFYCGFALLLEDVDVSIKPLTMRSGKAKIAMSGSIGEQVAQIANEAGVRQQL